MPLALLHLGNGIRLQACGQCQPKQCLDGFGVTETLSLWQGSQRAPLYVALQLGAVDVEGKALLVPTALEPTVRLEGATHTEFVVVVLWGGVEWLRLVLVYVRPRAAGPAVWCK